MNSKKVLYLISTLGGGGAETQLCAFAKELRNSHPNTEFFICALKTGGVLEKRLIDNNIRYVVFNERSIISNTINTIKFVKKEKIDIIHAHMLYADFVARFTKIFTKVKVVATHHGLGSWKKKPLILIDKLTKNLVDKFVMVSDKSKEIRLIREKYPLSKIEVLYNGISKDFISKESKKLNKKVILGTIARFTDNKQIDMLIDIFSLIIAEGFEVELEIIGDGENKDSLLAKVEMLNLTNSVTFHGWVDNIVPITSQWNIFVMCSLNEDFPVSLLEAMGQGIVPVASNVGGIPVILKSGEMGMLANSKDKYTFVNSIKDLLNDAEKYKLMSEKSIEHIKQEFLISKNVQTTLKIYEDVFK